MKPDAHVAGENVLYLEQGMQLIRRLDELKYTSSRGTPFRGGVGAQFRHCIDFYSSFLAGLSTGRVDYSRRDRDARIETDRQWALQKADGVRRGLLALTPERLQAPLEVKSEETAPGSGSPEWSRSSVGRELQFLVSHTIHHYALIALMLSTQGHDVSRDCPEFGVAPSTLAHWKESGTFAG